MAENENNVPDANASTADATPTGTPGAGTTTDAVATSSSASGDISSGSANGTTSTQDDDFAEASIDDFVEDDDADDEGTPIDVDTDTTTGLGAAAGQPELSDALGTLPAYDQASPRPEVPGGRSYEIIFIVRTGDVNRPNEVTARVRDLIEGSEGAVDHVRTSEVRRLAYPIKKQTEGYYVVINSRFRKDLNPELERLLKLDEDVLRYMLVREDD